METVSFVSASFPRVSIVASLYLAVHAVYQHTRRLEKALAEHGA